MSLGLSGEQSAFAKLPKLSPLFLHVHARMLKELEGYLLRQANDERSHKSPSSV